jgi:hypothetical protein
VSPRRIVEIAALWVAALLPASFLANAAPWWRLPAAGLIHIVTILVLATGITARARAGRWGQSSLGPAACIAVLTAVVLGADVIFGSPMQLNALAGYSPLVAGRFTGFGYLAFAVFATAALLGSALIAQGLRGAARVILLAVCGLASVLIVGGPGADVGGIIALTPAFVILTLRASGIRLSAVVLALAGAAGALVVTVFAFIDYARPPQSRTHLGRFVGQVGEGTAGVVIRRKAEANLSLLVDSQLTILVLVVLVFVPLVLMHGTGGMRRVFGLYPSVRAGMIATVIAAVIGFAVNDSGIAVPAFAAALAVPLAVVTTLRVRAGASRGILFAPRARPAHGDPEPEQQDDAEQPAETADGGGAEPDPQTADGAGEGTDTVDGSTGTPASAGRRKDPRR